MVNCKGFVILPVIIIISALVIGYSAYQLSVKDAAPTEKAAEAVLRQNGIDIDFSPDDDTE